MEIYNAILASVLLVIIVYETWFTPTVRSTRELKQLNRIWQHFNEGTRTYAEIRDMLDSRSWSLHPDKVALLLRFMDAIPEADHWKHKNETHES